MFELIDCKMCNAFFNSISVISQQPVPLSMLSWGPLISTQHNVLFKPLAAFPQTIVEGLNQLSLAFVPILLDVIITSKYVKTADSSERDTYESCCSDYHQSSERILAKLGFEPSSSCSQVLYAIDCAMGLMFKRLKSVVGKEKMLVTNIQCSVEVKKV